MISGNAAVLQLESRELAQSTLLLEPYQGFLPHKVGTFELHDPAEACFPGIGCLIDIISIQRVTNLQTQGVASCQAYGEIPNLCPSSRIALQTDPA